MVHLIDHLYQTNYPVSLEDTAFWDCKVFVQTMSRIIKGVMRRFVHIQKTSLSDEVEEKEEGLREKGSITMRKAL